VDYGALIERVVSIRTPNCWWESCGLFVGLSLFYSVLHMSNCGHFSCAAMAVFVFRLGKGKNGEGGGGNGQAC
jgi:hypothetical protein